MSLIRPPRKHKPSGDERYQRVHELISVSRQLDATPSTPVRKIPKSARPWMAGRPIAQRLIGIWALNRPTRWTFWDGASPQLKDWNHTHPPIRSIQIDLGLTDEQANYLFRNKTITTYDKLVSALRKVEVQLRGKYSKAKPCDPLSNDF